MNSASSNQLLQKLQNLYSTQKKGSQHSHSPIKPIASKEINQLLQKSSPVPYLQIKQYDVEQWTDRIVRQMDKHGSFTQNEIPLENQPQKCSLVPSTIQQSLIKSLTQIEKQLKQLRYAKDQDQNTFATILTKIKLFCLDNSTTCFDFYRCTDLILLKYMIYLLNPGTKPTIQSEQKRINTRSDPDIVTIVYEIIEEIKSKQHITSQIDNLNNQLTKIQNSFKPQPSSSVKTISKSSHHQRFNSCNLEKNNNSSACQNKLATEINLSANQFKSNPQLNHGSTKIIKYQIDELEQKSKLITSLNDQILKLQNNNKKQILSISELNAQNESFKSQLQSKIDELEQLKRSYDLLKSSNQLCLEEKEQYLNLYHDFELESIQLKQNLEKYKTAHDQVKTQFDKYQNETYTYYQEQCNQLQQTKDREIKQLKSELNEKSSIIAQLLGDTMFFGKQYKNIVERIVNLSQENIGNEIAELQKELFVSQNTLNAKLNAISSYSDNILQDSGQDQLSQSQLSNMMANRTVSSKSGYQQSLKQSRPYDLLNGQKNQFELMHMLLIQSQVLDEFLS
ncbi:unnamed protein product (macronuclear) [Paramecium tetraurelia]|uniref:Uncharacterized protein n=1 Tax=Paramecium tetraurelia TaxID=5888 RepID=A0BFM6_PARTE|nr:uncharacterized protein GSPATT00028378001 [Paramecium tetraurelia]CAK57343.1 unnamed protein product [Paramecium tetraurelia]|eukprot:XP_001424741.1 hypothetical protein (macronuclear) [Paramecium tetraurelia strain d4-2]